MLEQVPFGNYMLIVYGGIQASDTFRVAVDLDTTDLGALEVRSKGMTLQEADLFFPPGGRTGCGKPGAIAGA